MGDAESAYDEPKPISALPAKAQEDVPVAVSEVLIRT